MNVQEYAVQTGKSVWQVYRDLKAGNVHGAHRPNGRWKIPEEAIKRELLQYNLLPPPPKGSVEWYDDRFYLASIPIDQIDPAVVRRFLSHPRYTAWVEDLMLRVYLPSVTTYLEIVNKPFLGQWRGDIGNREADRKMHEAAARGSRVHHACEVISQGGYVVLDRHDRPRYTPAELAEMQAKGGVYVLHDQVEYHQAHKWLQWLEVVNPEVIALEKQVYSLEHEFAGTLDMLCNIKPGAYQINGADPVLLSGRYIVDIKTGKSLHDEHWLQMAAYRHAIEEGKIDGALIVHTNAQTRKGIEGLASKVRTAAELEEDFRDFKAAQKLWMRQNEVFKPRIMQLPDYLTYQRS